MQTNRSSAGLGTWARRAWLAPLVLSLFGCGGSSDSAPDATTATGTATPATSTPEDLRGQWETILTYVPPFYSGPYGDIPPGDGSLGISLYLSPDGQYQHDWNLAQAYFGGNCFRSAGWDEVGTISGTGPEFTFTPAKATYSAMDSCGQSKFLDPAPVAPASHTLTLDHDASGWPLLRISFPTGELVLEKCRHCQ
ncbi:MAG TPA: hypothetical protein VGH48_05770 [Caldimonas sp.]|jgi:hypothetical protein